MSALNLGRKRVGADGVDMRGDGQAVAPSPLPSHGGPDGETVSSVATRSRALAALLADAEVRKSVGGAWPVYAMLVLAWGGTALGTRDEIGQLIGEDGRNVGNWVAALAEAGIVKVEKMGRRMSVALTGAHMDAARLPDTAMVAKDVGSAKPVLDEREQKLLRLLGDAKLAGGTVEIRIGLN